MTRYLILVLLFGLITNRAESQTIKRYHQSFEVEDITAINIDAVGDVTVNTWAGNTVLVEVYVSSENGSTAVMKHLQAEGRYDLKWNQIGKAISISNKMQNKQTVKIKGVEMVETIKYIISIPDTYTPQDVATMRSFLKV
jgi:hypothetical protein